MCRLVPFLCLFSVVLSLTAAIPAAAQDCFDYLDIPHVVAQEDFSGGYDITVTDDGQTALIAAGGAGLRLVDISDPLAPVSLGYVLGDDLGYDVVQADGYAYLADREAGVQIYDVSDPTAAVLVGTVPTSEYCFGVALAGSYLYASDHAQLNIIDIADPTSAGTVGTLPLAGYPTALAVQGDFAYVISNSGGLYVVDVSEPTAPSLLTTLPLDSGPANLWLTGDMLYLSMGSVGLTVVDVANPAAPQLRGTLETVGLGVYTKSITEHFGYVYLGTTDGLQIIDVLDPDGPVLVNNVAGFECQGVALHDDRVFTTGTADGMKVIDVAHPDATALTATFTTAGFTANDMVVRDGLGYIAHGGGGLQIVDLTDPDAPTTVGTVATLNSAVEIEFFGDDAVVVCDLSDALHVIDIGDPAAPAIVGTLALPEIPNGLAVATSAQQAYVTMNWGGVKIIDLSDPANPTEMHEILDLWMPGGIAVDYPVIYFADGDWGFQAVDVSNPYAPVRLSTGDGYGYQGGVALDLEHGLAYTQGDGLAVFDISDPAAMSLVTEVPLATFDVLDIVLEGDMAYIASATAGLQAVDISDPVAPVYLAGIGCSDEARYVTSSGERIYLSSHFGQVDIYLPHCTTTVAAPVPTASNDLTVAPNPFNPRTTLSFALERSSRMQVAIYDARGRRVRQLFNGEMAAGAHALVWDGQDDAGRGVAAGVYCARLQLGTQIRTAKLALVR